MSPKLSLDQSIDEKVSPNNDDNNNKGDLTDFSFALCCAFNLEKYFTLLKNIIFDFGR